MAFRLTIEQGKGRGQSFDFDAEEIVIGRSDEADIVLADGGVSRRHARIVLQGDRWALEDLETANGTFLNGSKVDQELLENGDQIGIGQVVFVFEADAPAEGSTRIVSVPAPDPDATNPKGTSAKATGPKATGPKAAASAAAAPAAGARRLSPKQLRIVAGAAVALLAAFAVSRAVKGGPSGDLEPCPNPLVPREGIEQVVLGKVDGICDPGANLVFAFEHTPKTRVILHFAPFLTEKGELVIELNGKRIGEAQLAPTRRSTLQTLVLPDAELDEGEENKLVFKNTRGADELWGLERVEFEVIGLNLADIQKAQESYDLGTRRYRERSVAAPNLYQSWMFLREARRYMEGLDPKPAMYQATLDLTRDVEKDLDKLCKERLFEAQRLAKYGKISQANEAYKFVLAAFPGNAHPCRQKAEEEMFIEEAPAE